MTSVEYCRAHQLLHVKQIDVSYSCMFLMTPLTPTADPLAIIKER